MTSYPQVLEVPIDKGMQDKQKIVFAGEADQAPGTVPGDVVFVLQCKKHHQFLRKGDDLLMEHKVDDSLNHFVPNTKDSWFAFSG